MKRLILFFITMLSGLFPMQVSAQSLSNNYVQIHTYLEAGNASKRMDQIQYFDDLGREEQLVLKRFAPNGQDVVSGVQYDSYGRNLFQFNQYIVLEAIYQIFQNKQPDSQGMLLLIRKLGMKILLWNECSLKQVLVMFGIVPIRRSVMFI
jgi:hypothetical protein